jgi:two-component system response regulator NreC
MLIDAQPDMEVVGEAADADGADRSTVLARPDVALVDLSMPGGGIKAIERIRARGAATRVLVLTMHDVPAYLRAAVTAGAAGYVLKSAADSDLLAAIRAVHRGHTVLEPSLAALVVHGSGRKAAPGAGSPGLSAREREVLDLVAQGYTNQQIADRLGLSVKTVETYRARLVEKLGLRSRAELVRYAMDSGVLGRAEERKV